MNGHFSAQLFERYRRRTLPPAELLDADDHLAACEMCRRQLGDEQHLRVTAQSLRAYLAATGQTHLVYEQLAAYVEGALDPTDREIADGHLEFCARCVAELDELRAFARQMEAYPAKKYAPVVPSPTHETLPSFAKRWWQRFETSWRSPVLWLPVRLASLGLIVALLLWAASLKSQNSRLQTALSDERQRNETLQQDAQAANAFVAELRNQLAQLKSAGQSASSIVVTLNDDGGQVTLDKNGNVAGVSPEYQQAVKQTLATERIETPPLLAGLIGKSGTLMGPTAEGHPFALLAPLGTVVMSDRPTFRWRALEGADSYVIRIYDAEFNEVAVSPQLSETAWPLGQALERGRTYSWQVTARVGEREVRSPIKPAPEARFMVLDRAKANELAKAKNAGAGSHLTLGILYAQAGLLDDAERELQSLLRANPQSALAQKLLRSVISKRRG
jgi:cell division protein FtsB